MADPRATMDGNCPASPGGPSLASLQSILENNPVAHQPINEWLSSNTRDIHARLAFYSFADGTGPAPSSSHTTGTTAARSLKTSSSMAARACLHQSSNASNYPPSLLYTDATPTESSVSTGLASRFSGVPLLEEVDGVLERRPNRIGRPAYECSFWFLSCSYISYNEEEWRIHCLSHFRGEEPPKSVQCPLCEEFKYTCDDGWHSWEYRMDHVASHHLLGHTLRTSRPDFHLYQHLWQKRIIDDQDLKELKGGNHNLTRPPANFTLTNGRRGRDGRSQRHQVGIRPRQLR